MKLTCKEATEAHSLRLNKCVEVERAPLIVDRAIVSVCVCVCLYYLLSVSAKVFVRVVRKTERESPSSHTKTCMRENRCVGTNTPAFLTVWLFCIQLFVIRVGKSAKHIYTRTHVITMARASCVKSIRTFRHIIKHNGIFN